MYQTKNFIQILFNYMKDYFLQVPTYYSAIHLINYYSINTMNNSVTTLILLQVSLLTHCFKELEWTNVMDPSVRV